MCARTLHLIENVFEGMLIHLKYFVEEMDTTFLRQFKLGLFTQKMLNYKNRTYSEFIDSDYNIHYITS